QPFVLEQPVAAKTTTSRSRASRWRAGMRGVIGSRGCGRGMNGDNTSPVRATHGPGLNPSLPEPAVPTPSQFPADDADAIRTATVPLSAAGRRFDAVLATLFRSEEHTSELQSRETPVCPL